MTTGSHSEPCINWPCTKGAGHAGPCGTSPDDLSSIDTESHSGQLRGDGETYSEPDYEGDWASGYYRCYSCSGAGGYYECFLCMEEGDDY